MLNSTTGLGIYGWTSCYRFFLNRYAGVNPANGDTLWYTADGELTTEFVEEDKSYDRQSFRFSMGRAVLELPSCGKVFHYQRSLVGWLNAA